MQVRFKLVTTTLMRLYLGFIGGSPNEPTGDDPLAGTGVPGVMVGFRSGDTTFQIMNNDTAGATIVTDTSVPVDTAVHTVSVVADETAASNKFAVRVDSGSYTTISANIPTATNLLAPLWICETNEAGVAKNFQLYGCFMQTDK
jgi:hypothetical protein